MVVGSKKAADRGQGRRVGGMIKGAMSAMVFVTVEVIAEVTLQNVTDHVRGIPGYRPSGIRLGDGTWINTENLYKELGFLILPDPS